MNKPKLVVGITQGDSNGIGYEVLIKSLADSRILDSFTPVVYGSPSEAPYPMHRRRCFIPRIESDLWQGE